MTRIQMRIQKFFERFFNVAREGFFKQFDSYHWKSWSYLHIFIKDASMDQICLGGGLRSPSALIHLDQADIAF